MNKMIANIFEIFVLLLVATITLILLLRPLRIKRPKVHFFLFFLVLIGYFIALYFGQKGLIESVINGTSSIGIVKEVKGLNPIDLQYNVTIELKDEYQKKNNAKEATYNFSQNELKGFKLQKRIKKSSKIKQISEDKDSYKQFKRFTNDLRTVLNSFAVSIIFCMAVFLVFGSPRSWDSTIILIIKFLSIFTTLGYFINSDLKNLFIIFEVALFYTISEFLFYTRKWYCDKFKIK